MMVGHQQKHIIALFLNSQLGEVSEACLLLFCYTRYRKNCTVK